MYWPLSIRPFVAVRYFCLLSLLAVCGLQTKPARAHGPAEDMAYTANAFLAALDPAQRAKATFPFKGEERGNWHFIPRTRQGLPLKEMTTSQRQLAFALLQSALSQRGSIKSLHIMTLEQILYELENQSAHRDSELYFFSVFGTPSTTQTWGWRVEGHHLSVNFTLVQGHHVVSTPSFFGANPAEVKQGPRQGLRVLAVEEDLGRELAKSLTPEQQKVAILATEAPSDIISTPDRKAQPLEPMGLAAKAMNPAQRDLLDQLIKEYVTRLRPELAEQDLKRIHEAGVDTIHFAWAGALERGEGHYYRVQGPTFILELDNTQNNANHVHCVWRDFQNDFGEDLLRKHYAETPHN